jgi:hypothetical protein
MIDVTDPFKAATAGARSSGFIQARRELAVLEGRRQAIAEGLRVQAAEVDAEIDALNRLLEAEIDALNRLLDALQ